jgi:hypothetical protein
VTLRARAVARAVAAITVAAGLAAALLAARIGEASAAEGDDALAVEVGGRWETWWRRDRAPRRYDGEAPLAGRVNWRGGAAGVEWGELRLRGASEAWRTRVVVVRLDPTRVELSVVPAFTDRGGWTVADADSGAALALDAGQFRQSLPWGWVVSGGKEILSAQYAPLAGAVVVEPNGAVRVVSPDSVAAVRALGTAREAFQSYPMLLQGGAVPEALTEAGRGIAVDHRDARLALGTTPEGRVIIALTRFDALGETLGRVPLGLTSAEMAAVMGALGSREALLLDGGISGQLLLRDSSGVRAWPGSRSVPLGLVGRPRR